MNFEILNFHKKYKVYLLDYYIENDNMIDI